MTSIALSSAVSRTASEGSSDWSRVLKRIVNGLVAARAAAAERELRRRAGYENDAALIQGEFRKIGLNRADLLPFNV